MGYSRTPDRSNLICSPSLEGTWLNSRKISSNPRKSFPLKDTRLDSYEKLQQNCLKGWVFRSKTRSGNGTFSMIAFKLTENFTIPRRHLTRLMWPILSKSYEQLIFSRTVNFDLEKETFTQMRSQLKKILTIKPLQEKNYNV